MKWFKHFSDALDDPFIQELIDEFGPSGYLAWFGLIEIISKENGNKLTGKLEIRPAFLKRKLRISVNKLKQIYTFCSTEVEENLNKTSTKPKLLFNFQKEKWIFDMPKMLELKDNYLKDLQASGKKPSKHKEVEVEEEVEEEKKTYVENSDEFRLAKLLSDLILENSSTNKAAIKAQQNSYQKWADDIRKTNQIDNRSFQQIEYLIKWSQKDSFWFKNVHSVTGLRKNFDKMADTVKEKKETAINNNKSQSSLTDFDSDQPQIALQG